MEDLLQIVGAMLEMDPDHVASSVAPVASHALPMGEERVITALLLNEVSENQKSFREHFSEIFSEIRPAIYNALTMLAG